MVFKHPSVRHYDLKDTQQISQGLAVSHNRMNRKDWWMFWIVGGPKGKAGINYTCFCAGKPELVLLLLRECGIFSKVLCSW